MFNLPVRISQCNTKMLKPGEAVHTPFNGSNVGAMKIPNFSAESWWGRYSKIHFKINPLVMSIMQRVQNCILQQIVIA